MVKKNNHISTNIGKQIGAMRSHYPNFSSKRVGNEVVFRGKLKVKQELPEYSIVIHYRGNSRPLVFVEAPELVPHSPHTYPDNSLCLYHPNNFHWTADKFIAKEIIQWTMAWIYFYEYWKDTGEWVGPAVPHDGQKIDNDNNP